MYGLILICGLGVGFYLYLLAELHRDGRRHQRVLASPVRAVKLGTVFEFDTAAAAVPEPCGSQQSEVSVVSFRPASARSESRPRPDRAAQANVVYLAAPYSGNREPYCS